MNNSLAFTVFFSLFLCFTFTTPLTAKTIKCNPNDKKVLLEIKAAFGNPYHLASWDPTNKLVPDCCDWYALKCDIKPPYRIVQLNIFQANISSQIPAAVGDLPFLQQIFFHHITNLTGTIPPSIAKLTDLNQLTISNTNLSGPIPTFLTKLKKLFILDLSFNDFTGSIPPEFSQFHNLGGLHLDRNKLTGTIPESFGHFTGSIPDIYLSHNHLTGPVPESLGNLNLTSLDLSRNNLTGDASFLLGKNKTVQIMDLSRNNFTFDLSKVEFPASLTSLDLNHNKIFGSLPQQLTQLQFQYLNVSYNRLCGEIPQGGTLQNFDIYSYFHNRCLCGAPLPACTTQLPNQIAK